MLLSIQCQMLYTKIIIFSDASCVVVVVVVVVFRLMYYYFIIFLFIFLISKGTPKNSKRNAFWDRLHSSSDPKLNWSNRFLTGLITNEV